MKNDVFWDRMTSCGSSGCFHEKYHLLVHDDVTVTHADVSMRNAVFWEMMTPVVLAGVSMKNAAFWDRMTSSSSSGCFHEECRLLGHDDAQCLLRMFPGRMPSSGT
jgi:hypothetical protein